MEKLLTFSAYMDQLARKNGISHVFADFLEMTVCALSLGQMEDRYFEVIKRYNKDELQIFSSALAAGYSDPVELPSILKHPVQQLLFDF